MNDTLLTIAALIPAVILAVYIYKNDSAEKEPPALLAKLLFCGVIIAFPVVWLERGAGDMIYSIFASFAEEQDGTYVLSTFMYHLYVWVDNTIGVGLIEEGFKWLALYLVTSRNKNFNSLFDGVIYAVFVSLGFAAFENILYCHSYGWGTAISRMLTAVPAHTFFGIIMGYYYTMWHMTETAKTEEIRMIKEGIIKDADELFNGEALLKKSLIVPTLIHGFYDYCCSIEEFWATIAFYMLVAGLYIVCFKNVRKLSMADNLENHVVNALILEKYPKLRDYYTHGSSKDMWEEFRKEKEQAEMGELS